MARDAAKEPPFFCPSCGQKHRADLTALRKRPAATMRATCQGCSRALIVTLEDGRPACALAEAAAEDVGLQPGETAGRYQIEAQLSQGETSRVYRAFDPTTKRRVALKLLRSTASDGERRSFLRQVDVQAHIRHPSIMPVFDRGELADGRPYFTMELLENPRTLADVLDGDPIVGTALEATVRDVLLPLSEGVYVANVEDGIAHGALRPRNVVLDGETHRPYLVDFGFANPVDPEAELARSLETGPPPPLSPYLAPELARQPPTAHTRTDVWGLGAVLVAVLTGKPPLEGTGRAVARAAREGRVRDLPEGLPPALSAIARKALSTDPAARYVNARQLATDLQGWLTGARVRALEEAGGRAATRRDLRRVLKDRAPAIIAGVAALLLGLFIGSRLDLERTDPAPARIGVLRQGIEGLDRSIDRLRAQHGDMLRPAEARRIWHTLESEAELLRGQLATEASSPLSRSAHERLGFVERRFAAPPWTLEAPDGVAVELRPREGGPTERLEAGVQQTPPGAYELRIVGAPHLRVPLELPLLLRDAARPDASDPIVVRVPVSPDDAPPGTVLVTGGVVDTGGMPVRATAGATVEVGPFLMDQREVSNASYAAFLASLPSPERNARLPAHEPSPFLTDGDTLRVRSGEEGDPIVGIRATDAEAYCTWASEQEGRTVRLPTAAEYLRAAGAGLDEGWHETPLGPFGVRGLLEDPPEIVRRDAEGSRGYALRGLSGPNDPFTRRRSMPRAADATTPEASFRCVRPLPTP